MFKVLELSGLFVCLGKEEIAGLWFARGISNLADTMVIKLFNKKLIKKVLQV